MKIRFLIFILLLSAIFPISALDFGLNLSAELGLVPKGSLRMYESGKNLLEEVSFYGDFQLETQFFSFLFIGMGARMNIWKIKNSLGFHADNILFNFQGRVRFSIFEIGFRHFCHHPIMGFAHGDALQKRIFEDWHEEVYVKMELNWKRR